MRLMMLAEQASVCKTSDSQCLDISRIKPAPLLSVQQTACALQLELDFAHTIPPSWRSSNRRFGRVNNPADVR